MKKSFWTLAHNLTKNPVIFDSGHPMDPVGKLTPYLFSKIYTYLTYEDAIVGLSAFERVHPSSPTKVGLMLITIEFDEEVEMIDKQTIIDAQVATALKKLDSVDAELIRTQLAERFVTIKTGN